MSNIAGEVRGIYAEAPRCNSKCSLCGDTTTYFHQGKGKKKSSSFQTPFYFKAFQKVSWFRGDDEYLGRICKTCLEAGKLKEMAK